VLFVNTPSRGPGCRAELTLRALSLPWSPIQNHENLLEFVHMRTYLRVGAMMPDSVNAPSLVPPPGPLPNRENPSEFVRTRTYLLSVFGHGSSVLS